MKVGRKPAESGRAAKAAESGRAAKAAESGRAAKPRRVPVRDGSSRGARRAGTAARRPHEPRGMRQGPQTAPAARPAERAARPKTTDQAKARAKARKAKAPRVIRLPLRERLRARLIARLEGVDLRPQALLARIPFVVLVIGSLGLGLGITLWLSTDSAQRSYQLGSARSVNNALTEQKEALEREVLQAESAPALADAARNLGMIPSKDTAHLVQDPGGNWVVVGQPKPAAGAPPPPLNVKLPDPAPPAPPAKPLAKPGTEVPTRLTPLPPGVVPPGVVPPGEAAPAAGPAAPIAIAPATDPVTGLAAGTPGLPGPADTLGNGAGGLMLVPLPTVAPVPPASDVTVGPNVVPVPPMAVSPPVPGIPQ